MNNLEQAVIQTIAYFDVFDYPLTLVEIHKWLYQPSEQVKLSDIIDVLANLELTNSIGTKNGFYFLTSRQEIVRTRLDRYNIAETKFKIALRASKFIRWLAFIQNISVCNNVGYNNATLTSDIDFFIVVKKGRLWLSRLLVTLLMTVLGLRRHGRQAANRICLSFYVADDHLDLTNIALKPNDPYLVYWLATLAPIYNQPETYQQFMTANRWLKNYLPNFYFTNLISRRKVTNNTWIKFSKNFDQLALNGFIGDWLEKLAKLIQLKKIQKYIGIETHALDTKVVLSDSMLKLHKTDRRQYYNQQWRDRLVNLNI